MVPASPNPVSPNLIPPALFDFSQANQARWEQTGRELKQLNDDFQAWIAHRRDRDQATGPGQDHRTQKIIHKTRLDAVEKVFSDAIAKIKTALSQVDLGAGRNSALVYDDCRAIDFALVWLGRVWDFYRVKFDQRDDLDVTARVLDAADELVWSCYKQIFLNPQKLPAGVSIGPAPLPYIAPVYSPGAFEHGKPTPDELKAVGIDPELAKTVAILPVPLLRLPPWCIHSPWWLVFAAHEVGHHILYELKLPTDLANKLTLVLLEAKVPAESAERWRNWSQEILADIFSLLMVGPAALRALVEIERTQPARMFTRREKYPAPAIRLELMRRAANRLFTPLSKEQARSSRWELLNKDANGLALPGDAALGGFDPLDKLPKESPVSADLAEIDMVLDFVLGDLNQPFNKLENLCSLAVLKSRLEDPNLGMADWSSQLRRSGLEKPNDPAASLTAPRLIAASAIDAWERSAALALAEQRQQALDALAKNTVEVLLKSGPPGVRGEPLRVEQAEGIGENLAEAILALGRSQLDAAPQAGD